jgi:hypothetical protein
MKPDKLAAKGVGIPELKQCRNAGNQDGGPSQFQPLIGSGLSGNPAAADRIQFIASLTHSGERSKA